MTKISYTYSLVDDLEKRVTLTEVALQEVTLLLTDFRREGMPFYFAYVY